jgi:hypothetical protein
LHLPHFCHFCGPSVGATTVSLFGDYLVEFNNLGNYVCWESRTGPFCQLAAAVSKPTALPIKLPVAEVDPATVVHRVSEIGRLH